MTAARLVVGAAVLFLVLALLRRPIAPPKSRTFIWVGLLQIAGMTGLSTTALLFGDVSSVAILVFTMPLWTTILSRIVLGDRSGTQRWIAFGLAVVGLACIARNAVTDERSLLSAGLAILAGLSWAGGIVVSKRFGTDGDILRNVAWQQLVGAIPLVVIALIVHERATAVTPAVLWYFAFISVVGSGLGWLLWGEVVSRIPAPTVAIGSLSIPVVAAVAAFIQLGERPDALSLAGLTILFAAVVVGALPHREPEAKAVAQRA